MHKRVCLTAERLQAMEDNGYGLWATPGASQIYWAHQANFAYDVALAAPRDFLSAAGFDLWDGMDDGKELCLDVEMPEPRRGPGRPKLRDEPLERVEVRIPATLVAAMDAAGPNRTAFIEQAIRAALAAQPPAK